MHINGVFCLVQTVIHCQPIGCLFIYDMCLIQLLPISLPYHLCAITSRSPFGNNRRDCHVVSLVLYGSTHNKAQTPWGAHHPLTHYTPAPQLKPTCWAVPALIIVGGVGRGCSPSASDITGMTLHVSHPLCCFHRGSLIWFVAGVLVRWPCTRLRTEATTCTRGLDRITCNQ
jgi:hypothetical protein